MNRARDITPVGIGYSVLLLTACVLLTALWARSYWRRDTLFARVPGNQSLVINSEDGQLYFSIVPVSHGWVVVTQPRQGEKVNAGSNWPEAELQLATHVLPWGPMIIFPDWYFVLLGGVAASLSSVRMLTRSGFKIGLEKRTIAKVKKKMTPVLISSKPLETSR